VRSTRVVGWKLLVVRSLASWSLWERAVRVPISYLLYPVFCVRGTLAFSLSKSFAGVDMNLILFSSRQECYQVPLNSPRGEHLQRTLLAAGKGEVRVGVENGPRGLACAEEKGTCVELRVVEWEKDQPVHPSSNINWLLPYCRPHTGKRLLSLAAELGIARLYLYPGDKSERGYGQSRLWSDDGVHPFLVRGAEQAFTTHLPRVCRFPDLSTALQAPGDPGEGLAFDPYEATAAMTLLAPPDPHSPLTLAFGGERGWSGPERTELCRAGFQLVHLGGRIFSLPAVLTVATVLASRTHPLWQEADGSTLQLPSSLPPEAVVD